MNWGATWIAIILWCLAVDVAVGIGLAHAATQIVALIVGGHQ